MTAPRSPLPAALAELHRDGGTVRDRLAVTVVERGLRRSTALSYRRLLGYLDLLDVACVEVTLEGVSEALWALDNPNTRRAATVAVRAVLGLPLPIPRAVPRRYTLPDETTLRLALMLSRYEARGLLMAYAGLRLGEACAVRPGDLDGDRLTVARQVQQLHETGRPTTLRVGPVKSAGSLATVVVPHFLAPHVAALPDDPDRPDAVRESIRRAGRKVGVALNPHQLRHWYATTLLDRGANLALVSRQLRHSDPATTIRAYVQTRGEDIHTLLGE